MSHFLFLLNKYLISNFVNIEILVASASIVM